jgi:diguanylate cyclase (GGDEF)-like protein
VVSDIGTSGVRAWVNDRTVGVKLLANVIVTLLGLSIVAAVALTGLDAQMWNDRRMQVKVAVGVAEGLANVLDGQVRRGELSREAGRQRLLTLLQGMRYDGDKYFAVVLDDGTIIVHGGDPRAINTNDYNKQDLPGHFYMRVALEVAHGHPEGGFYPVNAALPGGARMKLNFIKVLPAWGFMLVSGLVITDVTGALYDEALLMALVAVPGMLLCILIAVLTRRSIAHGLRHLGDTIGLMARGQLDVTVPGLRRRDEIGVIGRGVEVFRQSMIEAGRLRAVHEDAKLEALRERHMLAEARVAVAEAETAKRMAEALQRDAEAALLLGQERERADRELHIQAVRFGAALSTMSEVLCLFDAADRLMVGHDRLAVLLGLPAGSITPGMAIEDMGRLLTSSDGQRADDARTLYTLILAARDAGTRGAWTLDRENGQRIAVNFAPMDHTGWLVTLEDITEQRRAEARIERMAHYDALTGLANRVLFRDRLQAVVAGCGRGERFAVLYLDLDQFKSVNDTLGHPVGDALLQHVTERLNREVRASDMIARLGGDEFAIVQKIDQAEDSAMLATRLIEVVSAPYELDGSRVVIGTSIGIALVSDDGRDVDDIVRNADLALYRSKANGRGRYCFFEPEMDAWMQARRTLDLDLRRALVEGEFQVFYQPLITIASDAVIGFEALVRWWHPERGLVTPAEFIPMAEESGLIIPLGNWVLRQACADAATWPDHLKVAVNLSPVQLGGTTLVADVAAALADFGLPASRLELEITETAMLADTAGVLAVLHQLRDIGLRIALDDFGTGFSSLSYLQRFPFSKVKIDRSFVAKLDDGGDSATIIAAVIDLCGRLGMGTTGEGVETETQLHRLAELECGEAQGYLFSKPMPADEIPAMLAKLERTARQRESVD